MKKFEELLISVVNDFVSDYDLEALFEELFPGMTAGELILEMYNSGMIPDDVMEKFIND